MYEHDSDFGHVVVDGDTLTYYHTNVDVSGNPPIALADISTDGGYSWIKNQQVNGSDAVFLNPYTKELVTSYDNNGDRELVFTSNNKQNWSQVVDTDFLMEHGTSMLWLNNGDIFASHRASGSKFTSSLSTDNGLTWTRSNNKFSTGDYEKGGTTMVHQHKPSI